MRRLLIRPGAIGDFIVSLPALESLRADFVEVWTAPPLVPLVRFADRARSIPSTGLDLLGVTDPPASLIDSLRTFDSIVSWYGANRADFRRLMETIGPPVTFLQALPGPEIRIHATDFYLEQVRPLALLASDGVPRISCPADRQDFAVIHPFSGSPRKNWPFANFRDMARELEKQMPVRWCAGPDDPPLPEAVRFDDLYELACWLAGASLYVGNDSGITHLAAAVGTPVLALFGPASDPDVWAPRGPDVRLGRWE
jgi:ADP-heptose:LPS heptosyltransferase